MAANRTKRTSGAARSRGPLVVASTFALGWVVSLAAGTAPLVPGHRNWLRPWDHEKYRALAEHPQAMTLPPFRWRLGVPMMARALPFDLVTSFRVLAIVGVWGTAVAMFVLLRRLRFDDRAAGSGMLLFLTFGWLTGYPLYDIWLPDAMLGLAIVVLAIAALDRRPALFAVVLLVAVSTKEQALLAAPLWYTFGVDRPFDRRRLQQTALLALPAVLALGALHLALPAGSVAADVGARTGLGLNRWDALPQDPAVLLGTFGRPRLLAYPILATRWTVGAFGTVGLLALAAPRRNARVVVRWAPLLAAVYLQPLFASNTTRLIALAFPVIVVLAVHGLLAVRHRFDLHPSVLFAVPLVLLVPDRLSPTDVEHPAELRNVAAVLLAYVALARWRSGHGGRPRTGPSHQRPQPSVRA